jgi:hypothetical protein
MARKKKIQPLEYKVGLSKNGMPIIEFPNGARIMLGRDRASKFASISAPIIEAGYPVRKTVSTTLSFTRVPNNIKESVGSKNLSEIKKIIKPFLTKDGLLPEKEVTNLLTTLSERVSQKK